MNQAANTLLLATISLTLCSCATYTIRPISKEQTKWPLSKDVKADKGYIFYQPELYFVLTITKDDKGTTAKAEPIYLPNYEKPYRVTTFNFLAKADFTFAFENGWKLTSIADKSDNSTVANTLAGQLSAIVSAAAGVATTAAGKTEVRVLLLRPLYNADGHIEGFKDVTVKIFENKQAVTQQNPGAQQQQPDQR